MDLCEFLIRIASRAQSAFPIEEENYDMCAGNDNHDDSHYQGGK